MYEKLNTPYYFMSSVAYLVIFLTLCCGQSQHGAPPPHTTQRRTMIGILFITISRRTGKMLRYRIL